MSVLTAKFDWGQFCDGKRPWSRTTRRTDQHAPTGPGGQASGAARLNDGGQVNLGPQVNLGGQANFGGQSLASS
jgi:hypothetical protein